MKILVGYASAHGSTTEVAEFIGRILRAYNAEVTVSNVVDVLTIDEYDVVVLGSAIHGGLWLQEMLLFTDRFTTQLAQTPVYFFVTCIRSLEPDGAVHAYEYYVDKKTMRALNVRDVTVFAGKLNVNTIERNEKWYLAANYDGNVLPGIMNGDFRDWEVIAAWAHHIAKSLMLKPTFEPVQFLNG